MNKTKKKLLLFAGAVTIYGLMIAGIFLSGDNPAKGYIDVHLHLGGPPKRGGEFGPGKRPMRRPPGHRQRTGRFQSPGSRKMYTTEEYLSAAKNLIAKMDKRGVEKAVIMPPPQVPGQTRHDGCDSFLEVVKKYPGRIFLLGGGRELNTMIHKYKKEEVTETVKKQFREKAKEFVSLGIKGFGETAALHLSLNPRHVYEEVQPDHPLYLLLADLSAEYGMPVDIHMEAVPENKKLPEGLDRVSSKNPSILTANIPAFERLLGHNRRAKIVWQHIGWDNTGAMTVELLRKLLRAHSNLYIALRVEERLLDMAGKPMKNRIVDRNWKVKKEWLELFKAFPDRFVIGSDEFIGVPGVSGRFPESFEATWSMLEQLPADLRKKIGGDNARRIYNLH